MISLLQSHQHTDLTTEERITIPAPSKHSPPATRPQSYKDNLHPELDDIESLSEIIKNKQKWEEFKSWVRNDCESEGSDSDGELLFDRYLIFLEVFLDFQSRHKADPTSEATRQSFLSIANHGEKFFGVERYLKVMDSEMRSEIVDKIKKVKSGSLQPSPEIFSRLYPKVWDKTSELLGHYQNHIIEKHKVTKETKPRKAVL